MSQKPETNGEPDEDEDLPSAIIQSRGPDKNDMTAEWLPEKDHWLVKTFLNTGDAAAIAAIETLINANPETDLDQILDDTLEQHYQALVSENGTGFTNYQAAIEAMHGKTSDDDRGRALQLVAADED